MCSLAPWAFVSYKIITHASHFELIIINPCYCSILFWKHPHPHTHWNSHPHYYPTHLYFSLCFFSLCIKVTITSQLNFLNTPNVSAAHWWGQYMLSYIDVLISHNPERSINTTVYRKPTHTNMYLDLSFHHPLAHKIAIVQTLHTRSIPCTHVFHCQKTCVASLVALLTQ